MTRKRSSKNTREREKRNFLIVDKSMRCRIHCCPDQVRTDCTVELASPLGSLRMPSDVLAHLHIGKRTRRAPSTEHHGHLESIEPDPRRSSSPFGMPSWML